MSCLLPFGKPFKKLKRSPGSIVAPDITPNQFTFTDVTNVAQSGVQTSNTVTIAGLGVGISSSAVLSGAASSQIQKNGGAWVSGPVSVINGDTLAVRHTSSAAVSTAVNTTLTISTISDTFTSTTAAVVTPNPVVLTLTSSGSWASASSPEFDIAIDGTQLAGDTFRLHFATNSGFTGETTQDVVWDGLSSITFTLDNSLGGGTYYERVEVIRDPTGANISSGVSNTISPVISGGVSSAALVTTTGTGKSSFMTVSGSPPLTFVGSSGVGGSLPAVSTTVVQASDRAQFEWTVLAAPTTGHVVFGLHDGTYSFNSTLLAPGYNRTGGIALHFTDGVELSLFWNAGGSSTVLKAYGTAGLVQVSDAWTADFEKSTGIMIVTRTRSGTPVAMGTGTAVGTLTAYYGYAATNGVFSATFNFGPTYAKTPATGVAAVWA